MTAENPIPPRQRGPWNKGRIIGQKRPLTQKDVWTIRVRLQLEARKRDLAMSGLRPHAAEGRRRIRRRESSRSSDRGPEEDRPARSV